MNTKEKIEVMQAWVDGKTIQMYVKEENEWKSFTMSEPTWNWEKNRYRIKPEPKEIWVNEYKSGSSYAYQNKIKAITVAELVKSNHGDDYVLREAVKYREVLDD